MAVSLEQEIRSLRSHFWSARDPDGRAFAPLADACRRAGDYREALDLLDDGRERLPAFTSGHLVAAWVFRDQGDLDHAEDAFRRVLSLDPENPRALHGLGLLLARAGRVAVGRELVGRALDLDPLLEWEEGGAPGGPVAVEDVVDIRSLAPEPVGGSFGDPDGLGAIVAIESLAPEAEVAIAAVGIGTLAPDACSAEPPVVPAPVGVADEDELEDEEEVVAHGGEGPDGVLDTRTMAELLERQGQRAKALEVYRRLAAARPADPTLAESVARLEASIGGSPTAPPGGEGGQS